MGQATLRTERLFLVPLAEQHLELEGELGADPEVMRFLGRLPTRREIVERHRERLALAARTPGFGFWAGHLDRQVVGWWLLGPPERAPDALAAGVGEIGYRLLPRHWRRGLAGEGARELVRHGFTDLGLRRIVAETMAVNEPSRATMRSIGLTLVRTFHLDWDDPLPGSEHGEVEYATTRDEWLGQASRLVSE